ncbi:hypothetical protein CO046_00365 [Candidatus Peregrinibacteria bacterium CG_4_9_14_0_2_um_filter_53_11]|nr:MAG: hypothetical protein CO046_00365 [Candidatus Peregrinibacteria bacterium CG_4_9_14_0_2_um_filter_53_11]
MKSRFESGNFEEVRRALRQEARNRVISEGYDPIDTSELLSRAYNLQRTEALQVVIMSFGDDECSHGRPGELHLDIEPVEDRYQGSLIATGIWRVAHSGALIAIHPSLLEMDIFDDCHLPDELAMAFPSLNYYRQGNLTPICFPYKLKPIRTSVEEVDTYVMPQNKTPDREMRDHGNAEAQIETSSDETRGDEQPLRTAEATPDPEQITIHTPNGSQVLRIVRDAAGRVVRVLRKATEWRR